MIHKKLIMTFLVALGLSAQAATPDATNTLNYTSPSQTWMGSLPLGNGRLGAMVYGGTQIETIAMNEVTLWSGHPTPEANQICGAENLEAMRKLFFEGKIAEANEMGQHNLNGHGSAFGTHLPFGDIRIEMTEAKGEVSDYCRQLDMQRATATVKYKQGGVCYTREYLASNPAQVLAVRYTADKKSQISVRIAMRMLRYTSEITPSADGTITIVGDARFDKNGSGGVKFLSMVKVKTEGGTISTDGSDLLITGADAFTLISDIRTDFQNSDYEQTLRNTISAASGQTFKTLARQHEKDFRAIYDRMDINLGGSAQPDESTDAMFARAKKGESNPFFDALFFKYGRYMLISSSRENSPLPANLQGIWNDNLACNMPWTCDYHLDINIQQNYWSSNIANLSECNEPLWRYLELLADYGHQTAQVMYGCDGWVAHTINNVWGATYPGDGLGWSMNVTAGAWMATHLWTHFDFTRDIEWLRKTGYPLMKETAKFFVDYMVRDPKTGWLLTGPSISPENGFRWNEGGYSLSMMPTIDRAVVYDIYKACIESSRALNTDVEFRQRLERDIQQLPPLQIGKDGELQEWLIDVERQDPAHRHASHLLTLYPFGQISPARTPELAKACEKFLNHQTKHGSWEDNEWSRGNMINFYARLLNGEEAYRSIIGLYTGFMRENLMTVSPAGVAGAEEDIFSFDATEAAVAGACEMLLQSYDGELHFLPALPAAWHDGSIKGVCARGGIVADFEWKDGKVTSATLLSPISQTVNVRMNGSLRSVQLKANKTIKL